MTGNGNHTICENGDDWGMLIMVYYCFSYGVYDGLLWFIMFIICFTHIIY